MKKRILSLLTALCLMLTLVPAALAAAAGVVTDEDTLRNAVASSGTVTLGNNITLKSPLTLNTAVVIDGTSAKYSITAPSGQNAINVNTAGVELKNLKINVTGNGYGINSTGPNLTVTDCEINAVTRGINFYPATGNGAVLTVTGTNITNSLANGSVYYSGDNRGIATGNVKNGTVTINNSQILGFKYGINAVVDPVGNLRDGLGTKFNVTNPKILGWTALNMWSVNTEYNFTNCTLVGLNTLNGDSNHFSTIRVNDGIYGSATGKAAVITFAGGTLAAAHYGTSAQSVIHAGYDEKTNFVFQQYSRKKVNIEYYDPENATGSTQRVVNVWNFYFEKDNSAYNAFLANNTTGYREDGTGNVILTGGTLGEFEQTYRSF